ncbi:hypothetical protein FIBSPDRAFT_863495 [Athelia psychrophila]|uniref:Uncharacterized protein n=1 Tax=Athelia psychrophila TaxID=1759441 RepID=A0A166HCE2_9AGAM|nr:hypothetical protein FIBSPDRAFT_863495 [Fibularhizoctonia sp. CBS 109695]
MHCIATFDTAHLRPSDFLDLSSKTCTVVYVVDKLGNIEQEHMPCTLRYERGSRFPAGSAGFLYYHAHPDLPAASEVRFRITPTADPATWAAGQDLLRTDGTPWSFPTIFLAQADHEKVKRQVKSYAGFWSVLQRDGLVPEALHRQCHALIAANKHSFHPTSRFYHSLDQLIPVNFAGSYLGLYAVGGSHIISMRIRDMFSQRTAEGKCVSPYTGSALCRLEKSTLPYHRHMSSKHLVMRIVKILTPVTRNIPRHLITVPLPAEDKLATMRVQWDGRVQTWTNNVGALYDDHPLRTMYRNTYRA